MAHEAQLQMATSGTCYIHHKKEQPLLRVRYQTRNMSQLILLTGVSTALCLFFFKQPHQILQETYCKLNYSLTNYLASSFFKECSRQLHLQQNSVSGT